MIYGASYNVFNAEEHLLPSLKAIRPCLDYINVVVQYVSNHGIPASPGLEAVIEEAKAGGLVDEVIHYRPNLSLSPAINELAKRNIGLQQAKRAAVDYFITLDCDEYYVQSEFNAAKQLIEDERLESTAVSTYLHIKRPIYRSALPDNTCCAFLTKLDVDSELSYGAAYPALVDPTRSLHGDRESFRMLPTELVAMRHMNLVRHNIDGKLRNSTNAGMVDFMDLVRRAYSEWSPGKVLMFPNKTPMDIIEVDDIFHIDDIFSDVA
ncbi:hypothetical protein [Rhizobium sp. PP-CC-3G-465]|uniref:hypothetical protein n=1 Tax=Rhizobium sp. PP-CC-3G-465 TaxID=2135648 RepID=UPI001048FE82|nr:hypothetical protein C8J33_1211 [Rhizobium sp. PP-CC-3G-465]